MQTYTHIYIYTAPLQEFPDNIAIRRLKAKNKIKGRKETKKTTKERRTHRVYSSRLATGPRYNVVPD